MILNLETAHGDRYKVRREDNAIMRCDMPELGYSEDWLFAGLIKLNGTDRPARPLYPPDSVRMRVASGATFKEMRFKNGAPRYTMIDIDHGTRRMHGNTRHHGIVRVWFSES